MPERIKANKKLYEAVELAKKISATVVLVCKGLPVSILASHL